MTKKLFLEYKISDLMTSVRTELARIESEDPNSSVNLKKRQTSVDILSAYPNKDAVGKPLPMPPVEPARYHEFIEISVFPDEAKIFDLKGDSIAQIALYQLLESAGKETTMPAPDIGVKLSYAARILGDTGRKRIDTRPAADADRKQKYLKAEEAYKFLTSLSSANGDTTKAIENGKSILAFLTNLSGQGRETMLLARNEYSPIDTGLFGHVDVEGLIQISQANRAIINQCVDHAMNNLSFKYPVEPEFIPAKAREIQDIMRLDSTAKWLLEYSEDHHLPMFFLRYTLPDSDLIGKSGTMGSYIPPSGPNGMEYVWVSTNIYNNADIAVFESHERRHFWQNRLVTKIDKLLDSPLDEIILNMLFEADAQAIGNKVRWNLASNHGKLGLEASRAPVSIAQPNAAQSDIFKFGSRVKRHEGTSSATGLKKATQEEFIEFLEGQFAALQSGDLAQSGYLRKFIDAAATKITPLSTTGRGMQSSKYLSDGFLTKLSQVGEKAFYLDDEGKNRVRKIFSQLPQIMANYNGGPRGNPFRL